jgi:hypothetical protein
MRNKKFKLVPRFNQTQLVTCIDVIGQCERKRLIVLSFRYRKYGMQSKFACVLPNNSPFQHTHKTSGVGGVGADFAVDLDKTLHQNRGNFLVSQSVFETIS